MNERNKWKKKRQARWKETGEAERKKENNGIAGMEEENGTKLK